MRLVLFLAPLLVYAQSSGVDWVQQVRNKPFVDARTFNFPAITPGGNLTGGVLATVTLPLGPQGLHAATDGWHPVRITGTNAEAVNITGGTCTPGAVNCNIQFTPANNHTSGAYTITSANGGAEEAAFSLGTTGGTVRLPFGTTNLYASLIIPSNVCIVGSGRANTTLFIPNNLFTNTAPWRLFGTNPSGIAVGSGVGTSNVCIRDLTIDMNGANQASPPNGSYGIEFINVTTSLIDNVAINNGPILTSANTFLPIGINGTSNNNVVSNNFIANQVCSVSGEGSAGIIVTGRGNRILDNFVSNGCNTAYISAAGSQDNVFAGNIFELGTSTMVAAAQAYAADNSLGARFTNNSCLGNNTAPACYSSTTDNASPNTQDTVFAGNIARNCGQGFQIQSTSALSQHIQILGGAVVNCATPLAITGIVDRITIEGVTGLTLGHNDARVNVTMTNGANQNVNISDAGTVRIVGPTAGFSIGGMTGGIDGRKVELWNVTGQQMTINNSDAGSSAGNQICTLTGGNVALRAGNSAASFSWSVQDNCWLLTSTN